MEINLLQIMVNVLMTGSLYCLAALGLTLVFSVLDIVNFAHGEYYMLGGFAAYYFTVSFGINYLIAIPLATIAVVLFSLFMERFTLRPIRGQVVPTLISTLGVSMLLQAAAIIIFGSVPKSIPGVFTGVLRIGSVFMPYDRLAVMFISVFLIAGAYFYVQRGKMGRAMRAFAQNSRGAMLQGVNLDSIARWGFGIGCGLAAASGALLGPVFFVDPGIGVPVILKSLTIIILGGFGSIMGTLVGAFVLAFVEAFVAQLWGTAVAHLSYYIVVLVVLLIRPRGLLGGHE